jgi:aminomethyltransferase
MKYIIKGTDASRLLNRVVTRDMDKLKVGQVYYTPWCDDEGKVIDDGTIARLDEVTYRMTSAEPSLRWLTMNAVDLDLSITDVTDQIAALSLQGPYARDVLNRCCEQTLDGLKYFRWMENRLRGKPVTISRTGYTGDMGYELWLTAENALAVWDSLMEAGRDHGLHRAASWRWTWRELKLDYSCLRWTTPRASWPGSWAKNRLPTNWVWTGRSA